MTKKSEPEETVTFEELLMSNVHTKEALINLLEMKGFVSKEALIEEIERIKKERK
jgi:hypothetical protein